MQKNYEDILNETCVYEQKPIKIDEFNKAKEKEVKERIEKRKIKRRKVAEQNKLLKKKREKDKETERELWSRMKDLNQEFKDIKNVKKKKNVKNNT